MNKMIIFSLATSQRQPPDDEYDTMRNHMLTGNIVIHDAKGIYKGQEEKSFICTIDQEIQEKMILAIAQAYKQECVLEIDLPSRKGHLIYFDGKPKSFIGIWKEAPVDVKGDFTLDLKTMKVYQCA